MKNKLRLKTNIKHLRLIRDIKNESYLVKSNILTIKEYLKLNRTYFKKNIG